MKKNKKIQPPHCVLKILRSEEGDWVNYARMSVGSVHAPFFLGVLQNK
jgi:hypothetical protein